MGPIKTIWDRNIDVIRKTLIIKDTEDFEEIGASLTHKEALELVTLLFKEFNMSKEDIAEATKPPKFYYKLPKGLYDSYFKRCWLDASCNSTLYYDKEDGGEPLTDDEFNALLKTYPSLSILEKFTEEEYEAYD